MKRVMGERATASVRAHVLALFGVVCLLISAASPSWADQGETWRVSVSSSGEQGDSYSGGAFAASISGDGRFEAFSSGSSNLVLGDTNGKGDIFVHDRLTGETERVSISSEDEQANGSSWFCAISADGRYVVFMSSASNLAPGDANDVGDVFVRDRMTGETERVSISSEGEEGDRDSGYYGFGISADGRYVVFPSDATNLVADDTNGAIDVFVRDRVTGETTRASVSSDGEGANWDSWDASISVDGRYVAFQSRAWNLVAGDTNHAWDIFVHDRMTGETERVSVSSQGEEAQGVCLGPSASPDGRYIGFASEARNLVEDDTNYTWDIFVHDRMTGETELLSLSSGGEQANGSSWTSAISAEGRYVAFDSYASNLVAGDSNGLLDVFVRDRLTGETTRVSVSSAGEEANDESLEPRISADGRYAAFYSRASNLVGDDTNGRGDVFVHQYLGGDAVAESPEGWFSAGWNVFGIPLDPAGWAEASNLMGFDCEGILWRWDPVGKSFESYPDDFYYLVRGRGYLLWLTGEENPFYEGLLPTEDLEIDLPAVGWTWIGHPYDADMLLENVFVRDSASGETRTAWEDYLAPDAWVNWNWLFWDSSRQSWHLCSLEADDDDTLHPWHAYAIWSYTDDVTLIFPVPD